MQQIIQYIIAWNNTIILWDSNLHRAQLTDSSALVGGIHQVLGWLSWARSISMESQADFLCDGSGLPEIKIKTDSLPEVFVQISITLLQPYSIGYIVTNQPRFKRRKDRLCHNERSIRKLWTFPISHIWREVETCHIFNVTFYACFRMEVHPWKLE